MKHIILSISLVLCFSFAGYACSCYEMKGLCQVVADEPSALVLGVVIEPYYVYNDTPSFDLDSFSHSGFSLHVIEVVNDSIVDDTIMVWAVTINYQCLGILHQQVNYGDTVLLRLNTTLITVDTFESYQDYAFTSWNFCQTNGVRLEDDTLRGLIYSRSLSPNRDLCFYYNNCWHPDVSYKINNVAYFDFKTHIQSGIPCFDYTSIQELPSSSINIYPNPATDNITFNLPANFNPNEVRLYNMKGQVVLSKPLKGNTIDVSTLASGLYFVELRDDNHLVRKKLFIEK